MPGFVAGNEIDVLLHRIRSFPGTRVFVAVAGPSGAGKSTLSDALAETLNAEAPGSVAVVPMDGFHYDDAVLDERDMRNRKGSPETFDVEGFLHILTRLKSNEKAEVAVPVFDRTLELSRSAARLIASKTRVVIIEGNYLLLMDHSWARLACLFDLTVMIEVPRKVLEIRLLKRWLDYGFDGDAALAKVKGNDILNVDLVVSQSRPADYTLRQK